MKFRFYSDLHIEFKKFDNWKHNDSKEINLILAGDIGVGDMATNMITEMCKDYRSVILVPGNHEYYSQNVEDVDNHFAKLDNDIPNFHFLNIGTRIIDDIRIIGGTMWTDLNKGDWNTCRTASRSMNDYHCISITGSNGVPENFTTTHSRAKFAEFKSYLDKEMASPWAGKTLVVTHHSPCELSVAHQFKGSILNYAYFEDMTNYMFLDNAPSIWIHGHMHNTSDYTIGNTRVLTNPRGYVKYNGLPENAQFDTTNAISLTNIY